VILLILFLLFLRNVYRLFPPQVARACIKSDRCGIVAEMPLIHSLLPAPNEIAARFSHSVAKWREAAAQILLGQDPRLVIILGPCSVHDPDEALEYGKRLKKLQAKMTKEVFLIMRVFFEKPRTRLGWKGLLYDPFLDSSNDMAEGLHQARKLLWDLAKLGVPCATEFLDPIIAVYLADLITWGLIGARTSASQPHRQLASGLSFPIGFKNGIYGDLEPAVCGIVSARMPHAHFSINPEGRISATQTTGNPLAHLVLRGSETHPNCDPEGVREALHHLKSHHLEERLIIDCAHGNSGKDLGRQRFAFEQCLAQIEEGNRAIRGLMLESNLHAGKQPIPEELDQLLYGVSITDPCLSWEETEEMVSSICMSSVQN
jgi:3-deoxy-7-phosphoheptulonate synthase